MTKEEKSRFDAAVQEAVAKIIGEQQQQFSKSLETAMKASLSGIDHSAMTKELDAAKALRNKAEKSGEQMAREYFEGRQKQSMEAAKTELLRDLVRKHLEAGKAETDIADWLEVSLDFVQSISTIRDRNAKYKEIDMPRQQLPGNPHLRYSDSGRGGTIWFENHETSFDMWWEFAGGDALVIVDIPNEANWEKRTKLPLSQRLAVLTFIGEQIVADKISSEGSFIIGEDVLTFYGEKG